MKNKLIMLSGYGLFWSWNLIFILLIVFLIFPEMIIPIVTGTLIGSVYMEQGVFSLLLFVVPLVAIVLGLTKTFRRSPIRLMKLFYGIELPLFFLIIARLTLFRELHPGTIHILILSIIAISAYGLTIISKPSCSKPSFAKTRQKQPFFLTTVLRQTAITCSLVLALYIALLLLFFFFPIGKEFIVALFELKWLGSLFEHPLVILSVLFVIYSLSLLLGLPLMLITLYGKAFINNSRMNTNTLGNVSIALIIVLTIGANSLIFQQANQQKQLEIFALLEEPARDDSRKKALLEKKNDIRQGLLNAYLASYRYLSNTHSSNLIQEMYSKSFALNRQGLPKTLQNGFNFLASPFLYQGKSWNLDSQKAADLYLQFFDTPIEKAESKAINQALKSNWYRDGMQAGLINKDQQKVRITKQSINIEEFSHSATISINESYQNQTFEQQEIYYYFSLPEEAVLTGVWLSDKADQAKKYAYTIAPRGAAQKLYKQERDRRVDPALLEQVGPRQYRLRVFPIEAKSSQGNNLNVTGEPLFMQLDYEIPLLADKQWRLPRLLEKRNVYWDKNTPLLVNNQPFQRSEKDEAGQWLPTTLAVKSATPLADTLTQLPIDKTTILQVHIEPRKSNSSLQQFSDQSIAVLIDSSYSMNNLKQALQSNLRQLNKLAENSQNKIDFYSIGDTVKQIKNIDTWINNDSVLFGYSTSLKQLNQWQQFVTKSNAYNAVILLTDRGNYEAKEKYSIIIDKNTPLWILHLGDEPAYAYADKLLDYIYQSGGGVANALDDILEKLIWKQQRELQQQSDISQNFIWHYKIMDKQDRAPVEKNPLSAIIAHQWISADFNRHNASQVDYLDDLHHLAKEYSLVSPFSSMIVLVNKRQEEELEKLSKASDRFKRDIETGKKSIVKGKDLFTVSSVPEPEEWALIIVVLIILGAVSIKEKNKHLGHSERHMHM